MIAKEIMWLKEILSFIEIGDGESIQVFADNQGAIKVANNPYQQGRTKHIDIRMHYIREKVEEKVITLKYLKTDEMIADMLTKNLGKNKFRRFRNELLKVYLKGGC